MFKREFQFDSPLQRNARSLNDMLQQRNHSVREWVETHIRAVLDGHQDEHTFVTSTIEKFRISIPQFDVESEHIQKVEEYDFMPSPMQGIFPNHKVKMWVVNFGIPYRGAIEYLRYIPRSSVGLSHPEFTYDDQYMWFKTWTPDANRDIEYVKAEKKRAIDFLQGRVTAATPELEAFNQQLTASVQKLFECFKQKYQKDKDMLNEL